MYELVESPKESKSRSVDNSVSQKNSSGNSGFCFVDNRSEIVTQRKQKEPIAFNSQKIQPGYSKENILQKKITLKENMCAIQRSTVLGYTNPTKRQDTDTINSFHHDRVQHTKSDRILASLQSGYKADRTDTTGDCNHAVPYKMIKDYVEFRLLSGPSNVANAENIINPLAVIYGTYPVPMTMTAAGFEVGEPELNVAIDRLIPAAANNVKNLFYWPDHTGDAGGTVIDEPKGVGKRFGGVNSYKAYLKVYENKLRADGLIP